MGWFLLDNAYIYDGIIVLDIAQDLEAPDLPLSALRGVYRPDSHVAVDRGGFIVDEFESALAYSQLAGLRNQMCPRCRTATLYMPHFVVSGLRLFRLTCHRKGTSRSVAM